MKPNLTHTVEVDKDGKLVIPTEIRDEFGLTPGMILRRRLQEFDFSPCTYCNSCELADSNQEDCFGNSASACGGCLWAQGLIQCP